MISYTMLRIKSFLLQLRTQKKILEFNKKTNNDIRSSKVSLDAIKGNNILVQEECSISNDTEIGSYSFIGFYTRITKTKIGKYCSIANFVSIGDGEHPIHNESTSSFFISNNYEELTKKDCIIGNDVWIGVGSIIRRGVTIGDGAIIGANSFVNKNVPPYTVVAGNPATIIKVRFKDSICKKLIESQWWDLSPNEAKLIFEKLNIEKLK